MTDVQVNKIQSQINEAYTAIGEFVVKFEQVNQSVHNGIVFFLHKFGLSNQQIANIILAEQTAEPLMRTYQSLIYQILNLNKIEKSMLDNVFKRYKDLIEYRNEVVHNSWQIGIGSTPQDDFSIAYGHKNKKKKEGNITKWFTYKPEEFKKQSNEAENLNAIFSRLLCIIPRGYPIEKNFIILENGDASVPHE